MSFRNGGSFFLHIDDVVWWYHQIFDVEVLMLRDMGVDGPLWYYSLVKKVVHLWAKMSWWLAESCSSTAIDDDDNASKQCSPLKKKKNQGYGTLLMPKILTKFKLQDLGTCKGQNCCEAFASTDFNSTTKI